ncbi:hypothetical protein [Pseudomonas synxantha]|uniref:hypothetical protein n=1 Tax=Pseudomonas synxantha TaxID=47883 RepID=UPI000518B32C|nr:hypothetical protein [Pseudomonas synxantha]
MSVIEPNEGWDEQGKLGVDWIPYADFIRRALSPAFVNTDDAVRYAQTRLGTSGRSIYGGLLLRRVDGLFVATEPLPVPTENFDPKWIFPDEDVPLEQLAPGMTIVARYRSRRDTQPGFLLEGSELQLRDGQKTPSAFVWQLLSVASMSVIQNSAQWGNAQTLRRGWLPGNSFTAPQSVAYAAADRAMGPVFDHADDAARHAHEQAGERSELMLMFGFLLKSAKGQWAASMPVNAEGLLFPLSRVFLRGQVPVGFTVAGLYLCAPAIDTANYLHRRRQACCPE